MGHRHRPVVPPGAADGDHQGGLPLLHILGQEEGEELLQMPHELRGLPVAEEEGTHRLLQPGALLELGDVVGVGQEAHVKDQVRVDGDAVLKAEGGHRHGHTLLRGAHAEEAEKLPPELGQVQPRGVEDVAGPAADRLQGHPLQLHRLGQGVALPGEGVGVPGLLIPPDDVLVGGLDEEELVLQVHLGQAVQGLEELVKGLPAPDVRHQGHPAVLAGARPGHAQAGEVGDQGHGHVVHAVEPQVLQEGGGGTFARPGQARDDDEFHGIPPYNGQKPKKTNRICNF